MPLFIYKFHLLVVFVALNFIPVSLFATEISVNTDRNPVNLNESVKIIFTANEQPDAEPDFSSLEKDFTILNREQQQSTQIINWEKTNSYQWIITVMAKRTGNLVIPAINFGKDTSQFSSLMVNKVQVSSKMNDDLFLMVEVNNTQPYIQQQVIYTLKLYRKVNISQASLSDPVLQSAVIEKLGEDKNYNTRYQGENYVVTERKYAIFPQKSGDMIIAPLTLTADVIVANQRRSNSFFNRQSTRTKRIESKQITLDVQAKPTEVTDPVWLPAKRIILQEKWSGDAMQVVVGEPVTRTLTLLAEGATVGVLPELYGNNNMPAHLKAYPDQPVLKEEAKESGVLALREEKIALIPGQEGTYTLPAIEVPWWNTKTQQREVARIDERTITAIAAPGGVNNQKTQEQVPELTPTPLPITQTEQQQATRQTDNSLWFWLTVIFASAWVGTLIYFLSKNARVADNNKQQATSNKVLAINKTLKQACAQNDPVIAKDVLLQWGREQFELSSLAKIAQQCDLDLQSEILSLNAVLYSNNTDAWQGNALWLAFQNNKSADLEKKETVEPLQALFKI